jgi:hypothetical protein
VKYCNSYNLNYKYCRSVNGTTIVPSEENDITLYFVLLVCRTFTKRVHKDTNIYPSVYPKMSTSNILYSIKNKLRGP